MNIEALIDRAKAEGRNLIKESDCRKCCREASTGKARCGYCHLEFEYLVKVDPIREGITACA